MSPGISGVRFAPSPTGRFHVGNLRTAWISERIARERGEPWIVRFEDIDLPRVVSGARETQLSDLAALGLTPDRIDLQSARRGRHYSLFVRAVSEGALYPCLCSRKDVQVALGALASAPHGADPIYTGRCRNGLNSAERPGAGGVAWRFRGADPTGAGDFIAARTNGLDLDETSFVPAYHWACAVDDFDGAYLMLVRAWDLATSTPLQREIQAWIGRSEGNSHERAGVFHTSLVVRNDGHRLEKRTAGVTLPELRAAGWTPDRIRALFSASFRLPAEPWIPERIFGETARERTLAELGF